MEPTEFGGPHSLKTFKGITGGVSLGDPVPGFDQRQLKVPLNDN